MSNDTPSSDLVLYILVRQDMKSMQHPGKAIAQGSHAANHVEHQISNGTFGSRGMQEFSKWEKQTEQGFGTVLVMGGIYAYGTKRDLTIDHIYSIVALATKTGFAAGITHDPTYPLQDGKVIHLFPCDTCGWVFGSKSELKEIMKDMLLLPEIPFES